MARQLKEKVEAILRDYPDTRNSDKKLVAEFWRCFNAESVATNEAGTWVRLEDVFDLTSPESIGRNRRLIQNKEGKYQATDPVVIERRKKEKGVRFTINSANPDHYLPN